MAKVKPPVYLPDPHREREIAVAAECDPRTVRKFLEGRRVQALTRRRIERALNTAA